MKPTQTYPDAHTDHITSFLPLPSINPHQVLSTSGDCTLSVFDVRKSNAVVTSEDQEDELLCSAYGDDSRRICVGTQSGFITVWKTGEWMDHVDRISPLGKVRKGDEPANVDCMVQMEDKVIVGLSDGWIHGVKFRLNWYGDAVGQCEEGVTC
jgi:WD40 repeat protein